MTTTDKIFELLDLNKIEYIKLDHEPVRTSDEAGELIERQNLGITKSNGAKSLLMRIYKKDKTDFVIDFVLPGDKRMNMNKIKKFFDAKEIRFLTEKEVIEITNGVLPGGVPPMGLVFEINTYFDVELMKHEKIAFNAGNKSISIVMKSEDWKKIVKPIAIY